MPAFHPLLILISILMNALFVVSEFVLIRIIKPRLNPEEKEDFGNRYLNRISESLNPHIFSAQIGITMSTILFGYLVMEGFSILTGELLRDWDVQTPLLETLSALLAIFVSVFMYTLLAEYMPKLYAVGRVNQIAKWIAPLIYFFNFLTLPLRVIVIYLIGSFFRLLRLEVNYSIYRPVYDEEELKYILERSTTGGKIEQSEQKLINRIFQLNDITAREILTPRVEVISIDINSDLKEIKDQVVNSRFSKFPIYDGSIDNIIGIIHVKEILNLEDKATIDKRLVKKKYLPIHEGMHVDQLLQKMRGKHVHIAIVYDEYGSFTGIVTLEDVLGALVGKLSEIDDNDIQIQEAGENTYRINPFISLLDFNSLFNVDITSEHAVSLGGFIINHNDGVPNEEDQFIFNDIVFCNFKTIGNRILEFCVKVKDHHKTEELIQLLS